MEQSQKQHQAWYLLPEKPTAVAHSGESIGMMAPAGFYSSCPRLGFAEYRWQKVPWAVTDTTGLLYVSYGLGQHRANTQLRTFLSFLTWAEKQRSPHFSSDDQLAIENLLPASFPLLNSLFLPPVLQTRSPICICTFQPCNEDQKGCCDGQN